MKEILRVIKEHFILLFGTGSFIYGLFNFDSGSYSYRGLKDVTSYPMATYYYYNYGSLILLTIGAICIMIGLLKIKKQEGSTK